MNKLFNDDEPYNGSNDGLVIFTEAYLLQRGYCCGNGCKNCPYDYKAVAGPLRKKLLEARKQQDANKNDSI